ncbi:MAG TPA: transposase, partial [Bacteroidales bacterium]|nr:transposase [Bacteroidales bacterium]
MLKGQRMSDKLEEAITGMYSRGMTTSDISQQVKEIYGIDVSEGKISDVTTQLCIVHQIRNSCKYVVW